MKVYLLNVKKLTYDQKRSKWEIVKQGNEMANDPDSIFYELVKKNLRGYEKIIK